MKIFIIPTCLLLLMMCNTGTAQNTETLARVNFAKDFSASYQFADARGDYETAIDIARAKNELVFENDSVLTPVTQKRVKEYLAVLKEKSPLPAYGAHDGPGPEKFWYVGIDGKIEQWKIYHDVKVTTLPPDDYHSIYIRNFPEVLTDPQRWRFPNHDERYRNALEVARDKNELHLDDTGGISPQLKQKIKKYVAIFDEKSPDLIYKKGYYEEATYYVKQDDKIERWLVGYHHGVDYPPANEPDLLLVYNFPEIAKVEYTDPQHQEGYKAAIAVVKAKSGIPANGILSAAQKAQVKEYDSIINELSPRYFASSGSKDTGASFTYVKDGNSMELWVWGDTVSVKAPDRKQYIAVMYESFPDSFVSNKNRETQFYFYYKAIEQAANKAPLQFEQGCRLDTPTRNRVQDIYSKIYDPNQMVADIYKALVKVLGKFKLF